MAVAVVMMRSVGLSLAMAAAAAAQPPEYDLVVVGGTAGGVACAVRAARQGLTVLLVNRTQHLGGMVSGGIGVADTQYEGKRAPIVDEFNRRILDYYRTKYGENSPQYEAARPGPRGLSSDRLTFEAFVAEGVFDAMVAEHKSIRVLKGYIPVAVERAGRTIRAALLERTGGGGAMRVAGRIFADATYEADLAALAGVEYRWGREDRNEYGEPHAGRIFTVRRISGGKGLYPHEAVIGKLNLRPFQAINGEIFAGSTGEGDLGVPAYHYRMCVTAEPGNQVMPTKPANYDPRVFIRRYAGKYPRPGGNPLPNSKRNWWQNPSCENESYPDGDWETRRKVEDCHRDFAVGLLYFLQNDPAVPADVQKEARRWGWCKDEFVDNNHIPYELYVREARRIVGRYVFTELDASLARGFERTPVHTDSIAIGEWFMDSHEVSETTAPGSDKDGKILLSEITRPSQIPYRTLLPKIADNLLVPVCLSSTHAGWGTIRLEPTWMHIGEAAGFAAALAVREKTAPAAIPVAKLQRQLVENRHMTSFFNDFDMGETKPWAAAVQFLAARGFFASYDARADEPMTVDLAGEWARGFGALAAGRGDGNALARKVQAAKEAGPGGTVRGFAEMLAAALKYWGLAPEGSRREIDRLGLAMDAPLTRGDAARMVYAALRPHEEGGAGR